MLKCLLRLSANPVIGLGHAVRCSGLIKSIRAQGLIKDLIIVGEGDLWRPMIEGVGQHISFCDAKGLPDLTSLGVDFIIHDYPFDSLDDWRALRTLGVPIFAIDDWGGAYGADLIFNGTVLPQFHQYTDSLTTPKIFCGPKFTLLRPEFTEQKWQGADQKRITIVIGSGEAAKAFAFRLLGTWPHEFVEWTTFVVGNGFDGFQSLAEVAKARNITLKQGLGASCLAKLLSRSRLAITTGGMIAYEVIALGVPALIYPQIDNLIDEIDWFSKRGGCLNLGFSHDGEGGGMDMQRLFQWTRALYDDQTALSEMSKAQKTMIDAKGLERITKEITAYLTK